jgi:hypothetical protein
MNTCESCGTTNIEGARFCDQCGAMLKQTSSLVEPQPPQQAPEALAQGWQMPQNGAAEEEILALDPQMVEPIPPYVPPATGASQPSAQVTSLGGLVPSDPAPMAPVALETVLAVSDAAADAAQKEEAAKNAHAKLVIERGAGVGSEFVLSNDESYIGRWDADNGIFPDVDLDAHDAEAKVSRRHARITRKNGQYEVEDLGSTNGTFINRGRRLLPGNPNILNDNDEIIVGKTFLRFHTVK